jgi:hypothetical protein
VSVSGHVVVLGVSRGGGVRPVDRAEMRAQ